MRRPSLPFRRKRGAHQGDGAGAAAPIDLTALESAPIVPDTGGAPLPRRRRWAGRFAFALGGIALVGLVGGGIAIVTGAIDAPWQQEQGDSTADITVTSTDGGEALLVASGSASLDGLVDGAVSAGRSGAVVKTAEGTYQISMPVVVAENGTLSMRGATVQLRSDVGRSSVAWIEARGGALVVSNTTVTSWDTASDATDTDPTDGRAWIGVVAGGTMKITGSAFVALGTDDDGHRGVTWGAGSSGKIEDSSVHGGFVGVEISGGGPVRLADLDIEGSVGGGVVAAHAHDVLLLRTLVVGSGADGVRIGQSSRDVVLDGTEVARSEQDGVVATEVSTGIDVKDSTLHDNKFSGLAVSTAYKVEVQRLTSYGNNVGVAVMGSSNGVLIDRSRFSSNELAGLHVASAGSVATLRRSVLDHNGSGLLVTDGNATIGPSNQIVENDTGVNILDPTPGVSIRGNEIESNFGDGVYLASVSGVELTDNRIASNQYAAFAVLENGLSTELRNMNEVEPGRRFGWERVLPDWEARLVNAQSAEVPQYAVPSEIYYFGTIPKSRLLPLGLKVNPFTTPNNLDANTLRSSYSKFYGPDHPESAVTAQQADQVIAAAPGPVAGP